ncbi:hypothetical protein [uncultured Leuconostoc sp.]|uniref:hypothetical protein n=1 Tax=uncultured Leuconostoc sp. TaxID=173262 RepID=UPI0025E7AB3E|nr:hypothetical protein [uncultured Leuconostoc sp.]
MIDLLGMIVIFADELFDVDDKNPFGFKFWLSVIVWLASLVFLMTAIIFALVLLPMLKSDIWWVIAIVDSLLIMFSFYTGKRVISWAYVIINNIKAHT